MLAALPDTVEHSNTLHGALLAKYDLAEYRQANRFESNSQHGELSKSQRAASQQLKLPAQHIGVYLNEVSLFGSSSQLCTT